MNNLSIMEINEIRPFFSRAYNEIRKLNHADSTSAYQQGEPEEESQNF